jgi:N-acetyl sugar amidotransferase
MSEAKAPEKLKVMHGLPEQVIFCKRCVMSNQRPSSSPEHLKKSTAVPTAGFGEDGICHACLYSDFKKTIPWDERERKLKDLLDKHRRKPGEMRYDCIVPGSGGKDSIWVSHLLKYKYGMNPLTITWAPHLYTDVGFRNMEHWIHSGFDNYLHTPNGKVHATLTRLAFENLCNPFQPFIMGQKMQMIRMAKMLGIKLVMYGENQAEYHNRLEENQSPLMKPDFYTRKARDISDLRFGSLTPEQLREHGITEGDLIPYVPLERDEVEGSGIEVHYTGYYTKWIPQEVYYYAVEKAGFEPNPAGRSEGTYSKYASLDDKTDGFNYYTMFIKFCQGRCTSDAAHEIRDGHIDRAEAVALCRKYDGEFPARYFPEFLRYIGISEGRFWEVINANRSPHLWKKDGDKWVQRHPLPD